jgi:hypothetical protein
MCETGRCEVEAARSVLAKVRGDVFALFYAVCCIVPWSEKTIERLYFSSDKEVITNVETWLDGQFLRFF